MLDCLLFAISMVEDGGHTVALGAEKLIGDVGDRRVARCEEGARVHSALMAWMSKERWAAKASKTS